MGITQDYYRALQMAKDHQAELDQMFSKMWTLHTNQIIKNNQKQKELDNLSLID